MRYPRRLLLTSSVKEKIVLWIHHLGIYWIEKNHIGFFTAGLIRVFNILKQYMCFLERDKVNIAFQTI